MQENRAGFGRRSSSGRRVLFGTTALAGLIAQAFAQQAPAPTPSTTVVVTGYRGSLESAAGAKRDATGFVDAIFAEDIGKFPDANIAESIARIPGLTVTREITGEGLQIQIRGLGTSFTRITLNGAPVASASTGRTDAQSANREVDLDFLPSELITSLKVYKSPTAAMLEGGAAGVVNMRSARPFDKKGNWGNLSFQTTKNDPADDLGYRGSAIGAIKLGDNLGILGGVAFATNKVKTTGFETIGWTNLNITNGICGSGSPPNGSSAACNTTGGGNWSLPNVSTTTGFGSVPANAGNGLTTGQVIDAAFLLARNPGTTIEQLSNALIPRLGRQMVQEGRRDRHNGILSIEYRPTLDLEFYVDALVGRKDNKLERSDMNWVGRNGNMIPLNVKVDRSNCAAGCVVTNGTFANAQFFLEYRPHNEDTTFWSINPGFEWKLSDKLTVDGQVNATRSTFHRESPTVLVITPASSGVTVTYDNTKGGTPTISSNVDLNNPANFGWAGGRVNVQEEKRLIETKGARANVNWGDRAFNVAGGAAYDDISRRITSLNNDAAWQNAICGNNLNVFLPAPNTTNPGGCDGAFSPSNQSARYPGFGTGFTAGQTVAPAFLGSLVSNANLRNYLYADPRGFIGVDFDRIAKDSNYAQYSQSAIPGTNSTNTGTNPGFIQEKVSSFYLELNGRTKLFGNDFKYNAGVRHSSTEQTFGTLRSVADPRNAQQNLGDGGRYPNLIQETLTTTKYENTLPSLSAAYNLRSNVILRASASESMTRPNPQDLRATTLQFSDPAAIQGTLTNSDLKPYTSKNLDVGLEWYTGREGYVAATYFTKEIKAFTAAQNTNLPFSALAQFGLTYDLLTPQQQAAINARGGPTVADVIITQQVNSDALLKVKGMELTWVQPLDFLPVKGFGFSANYTKIKQSATNNSGFIATGVAPHTYNLTGYYEANGIMLRLSQTFAKGSQLTNSPQNGIPLANLFGDDYKQLDFSSRVDIGNMLGWKNDLQLTFDIWNVGKSIQRSYFQFTNATFTEYAPGRTYLVGVRTKF